MAEELIISISGLRGVIGENLNAAIACEYGCAFGTFLKKRNSQKKIKLSVCLGRDTRPSGQMLACAVAAGLCSVGVDVIDLGVVTTPGAGIMLRELACDGGVVITASHNPVRYNGIKLLLENGIAPDMDSAEQIKRLFSGKYFDFAGSVGCGAVTDNEKTDFFHIEKILNIIDKEKIASKKYKVVLDSVNGAGGRVTKKLLKELGCEVFAINDAPTGIFAHTPEPAAENLIELCKTVKQKGFQIGFAQDPDADRLAIADENGTYIGEEYSLALAAKYIFSKNKGKAATNLSTSRMIDDIAKEKGCEVIRTAVGEANVAGAMLENNCIIGGEGNGGVIDLRVGPIRDSLVGIGLVLEMMSETGRTLSALAGEINRYHMEKKKFSADKQQAVKIINIAKEKFAWAKINTIDGCRFDFDDGWIHLRTSNTEPVMRVIVEAENPKISDSYMGIIKEICKNVPG